MHVIRAEGLIKKYGETTALDGVDLEVPRGQGHRHAGTQWGPASGMIMVVRESGRPVRGSR
ncbi:hypothetical protein AB0L53_20245 [Nonomuraea sp. NPDC052129]|uniref:hypothetical protein n=1 Tax=Nonomuraea sp. NPDC052129 TaxID=3154651 RepID=UPI00341639EF